MPMRLRPTPPDVPQEFIDRFGPPEDSFGPDTRFRVVAGVCGLTVLAVAAAYYVMALLPPGDTASAKVAIVLTAIAGFLLAGMWVAPRNWVFVCPGGVVRTRGGAWDGLAWGEVERFEDATLGHKGVTLRQCRLLLKDGTEWGFLADRVADYRRLTKVLARKVAEGRASASSDQVGDLGGGQRAREVEAGQIEPAADRAAPADLGPQA
jgi:hypothetical protein